MARAPLIGTRGHGLFSMKNTFQRGIKRRFGRISHSSINLIHSGPILRDVNFIMARQSYLASADDIKRATSMDYHKKLEHNDISYLKTYEKLYGPRFHGLYEATIKLRDEYDDVFAKHVYSRRTMKVEPVRLGIMPQYRKYQCYVPQYPMTQLKRDWMIVYTIENEKNGYWHRIPTSLHCIPYTMVPKKKNGITVRYRPAFDGRIVNQYCELFQSNMPTMKDFDEFHSIKGLFTMADIKNMFDNIPLHPDDQAWSTVLTPLGLFRMTHLAYGWKNAATNAQAIMNIMAVLIRYMIAYIDDILLKHPWHWGTKQLIAHFRSFLEYCRKINILLNPTKLFPYCTECVSFGLKRMLNGSKISDSYKQKILVFAEPTTPKQLTEFIGIIGYIDRYLYNSAKFKYWLRILSIDAKKSGKLVWTKEGRLAYKQLIWLVDNSPILHNPTNEGQFCVKTDACNYGTGAVLYQEQPHPETGTLRWVIIDMCNKIMAQQMRHSHSMVHEALAIVQACQHWQFHLLKRKFIVSTDNMPVASLFVQKFRNLDTITQKQLLRLRIAIREFTYEIRHIDGLNNELADGLSRYTLELYHKLGISRTVSPYLSQDTGNTALGDKDKAILDDMYMIKLLDDGKLLRRKMKRELTNDEIKQNTLFHIQLEDEKTNNNLSHINNLIRWNNDQSMSNFIEGTQTGAFNGMLKAFRKDASYLERTRITDYVNNITQDTTLISDEYAFNTQPINYAIEHFSDAFMACNLMTKEFKHDLIEITNQSSEALTIQDGLYMHEENFDQYKVLDTCMIESMDDGDIILPIQSRKKSRALQKAVERKYKLHRFNFINPDFDTITQQMDTRSQVLFDLFGHRGLNDIFNVKTIKRAQKGDKLMQAITLVLTMRANDQAVKQKDLDYVKKHDYFYYFALTNNQLKIDSKTGLLLSKEYLKNMKKDKWVICIPFLLRGKYLDYAHHNQHLHHLDWTHSYDFLTQEYYWPRMKQDMQHFAHICKLCKFTKGSIRHRAPMQIRQLPKPREHLMCDFLGPIYSAYGNYYILVIIDYATGWTMLVPTEGCGAEVIVNTLMNKWIPLFGMMATIETDYGSGFDSHLYRLLMNSLGVNYEYAERANHRSIGKVERVIGFIQSILKRFNVQLGNRLARPADFEDAWDTVQVILPHIQAAINQRRPRFTTISPNMLMFGSQLHDVSDISRILHRMQQAKKHSKISNDNHGYLLDLISTLSKVYAEYNNDYKKYVILMKGRYDDKWRVKNKKKIKLYQTGKSVLYYCGDRQTAQRKWLSQWTGPWKISHKLNASTRIITDTSTGNQLRVSIDRLKIYNTNSRDYITYDEASLTEDFQLYSDKMDNILFKYDVRGRPKEDNLDFRQNTGQNNNQI